MYQGFMIGDTVVLTCGAVPVGDHTRGGVLPQGTVGKVVGHARAVVQVDFGFGVVLIPPHFLDLMIDWPPNFPPPEIGDNVFSWDVYAALAKMRSEAAR